MEKHEELLLGISKLFLTWTSEEFKGDKEKLKEYDPEVADLFEVQILRKKLEWAGVDVIIPDYCALIIASCADTPAEVQMIATEILDAAMQNNNNDKLPRGYVITTNDLCNAFDQAFPIVSIYPQIKEHYDKKWDDQKIKDRTGIIDNQYDTLEFWEKYKNT